MRASILRDEPRFRLLLASQILSIIGDRVTLVVLPFAVLAAHGGVRDVAYVSMAQFLPFVVLALPAGVWADRRDRKRILIASDGVRLVTQVTTATLLLTDTARVPHLIVLTALYGAADAFFAPAFTGLLPATVAPANLQPANALRGLTVSTGSILGPVLAGLLAALTGGPGGALMFDAATFAVSIALLIPLRPRVVADVLREEDPAATTDHFWTNLRDGWLEVRARRWLLSFLGAMTTYHLVVLPAVFVIGPVLFAHEHAGARSWAVVVAGFGIGALLGDVLLLVWRPAYALRVAGLAFLGASCQAAFIGSGFGVWAIAALELAAGVCVTCAFTLWETSLQEHVPDRSLSRVSSYDYVSSTGAIPLGNLLAGLASASFGVHHTLIAMSVIAIPLIAVIASLPSVRSLPRGAQPSC